MILDSRATAPDNFCRICAFLHGAPLSQYQAAHPSFRGCFYSEIDDIIRGAGHCSMHDKSCVLNIGATVRVCEDLQAFFSLRVILSRTSFLRRCG